MSFAGDRFLRAQESVYNGALQELRRGKKTGCWMWFLFPQLRGLGESPMSFVYGLQDLEEAKAYLVHPVLGRRLTECCEVLLTHEDKSVVDIFGEIDARKLRSSMTLFSLVCEENSVFCKVLDQFFCGQHDSLTLALAK